MQSLGPAKLSMVVCIITSPWQTQMLGGLSTTETSDAHWIRKRKHKR